MERTFRNKHGTCPVDMKSINIFLCSEYPSIRTDTLSVGGDSGGV